MKPSSFSYYRPSSVEEAHSVLAEHGGKVLAGGQSLVPLLSMRLASPGVLVDINGLPGLGSVTVDDSLLHVGALVRHADVQQHPWVRQHLPLLSRLARLIGNRAVRNRGTTVGSLCHADPSAEMVAALSVLNGQMVLSSPRGERVVPHTEFFVGPLETCLAEDEIAVEARFPHLDARSSTGFAQVSRREGDYSVCGVAVVVETAEGSVSRACAAYLGIMEGPSVLDLTDAFDGPKLDESLDAAAQRAKETIEVHDDVHASAVYRRHLNGVLTRRALREALESFSRPNHEGNCP